MASRLVRAHEHHVAEASSKPHVKPRALIVVADGSEELETLVLSDILTRGDMHVSIASVGHKKHNIIEANHGLKIKAEHTIEDCSYRSYELIVLPGGLSASCLRDDELLTKMLKKQHASGNWYAGISSAPAIVFPAHGLLTQRQRATCDAHNERLIPDNYVDEAVVVDGKCVTSQGPATAIAFGLKLVELLCGRQEADRVSREVLSPLE
ncbi:putative transcriptional regulator dj-1, partial [Globisporangium splendens]